MEIKNVPKQPTMQYGAEYCKSDRAQFWAYCKRVAGAARHRAKARSLPFDLAAHDIDELLVAQKWCCAVSGIPLEAPTDDRGPFNPSLDRIVPKLGYVPGNVRVVCNLVNFAMNKWGEEPLRRLAKFIQEGE